MAIYDRMGKAMFPPGALGPVLTEMPPGMAVTTPAFPTPGAPEHPGGPGQMTPEPPGAPARDEQAEQEARRDRIRSAMLQAKSGFDAGLEAAPAPTPVTGPQPPQARPPGQIEGAQLGGLTQGPFPQRITPEMMQRQPPGNNPFPMSQGFQGGFPRFGRQRY